MHKLRKIRMDDDHMKASVATAVAALDVFGQKEVAGPAVSPFFTLLCTHRSFPASRNGALARFWNSARGSSS